jgi:hypothetical protein
LFFPLFSDHNVACISHLSHACCMSSPSHLNSVEV